MYFILFYFSDCFILCCCSDVLCSFLFFLISYLLVFLFLLLLLFIFIVSPSTFPSFIHCFSSETYFQKLLHFLISDPDTCDPKRLNDVMALSISIYGNKLYCAQ